MKKIKTNRRLSLNRETIRQIRDERLGQVGGGHIWSLTVGCSDPTLVAGNPCPTDKTDCC